MTDERGTDGQGNGAPGADGSGPAGRLAAVADEYFRTKLAAAPVLATLLGLPGHDDELSDPSRQADHRLAAAYTDLRSRLDAVDPDRLGRADRVTHSVLSRLLRDQPDQLRADLSEVSVSASVAGVLSGVLASVPLAPLTDPVRAAAYLRRLTALGGFFDGELARYRQAAADGRYPTALGVRQAVEQLDDYLATEPAQDPLLRPTPPPGVDADRWRAGALDAVRTAVQPALRRLRDVLADELAPVGRDDEHVGVCHVPGGADGYRIAARVYTTTDLTPDEIHRTGLDVLAGLRTEIAELGGRVLDTDDVPAVLRRLREDDRLRYTDGQEMLDAVVAALARSEQALPGWFRRYEDLASCEVIEMNPIQARGGAFAYYMMPAADGSRPGSVCVNTHRARTRFRFEAEAMAFHEGVPGHHLQLAVAQAQRDLPAFRRYGMFPAHSEGWGLYSERLADEMGLYTSDLTRLGMLSFDAMRACRLVVDTGLHHLGWSRSRAMEFMRANTAMSEIDIRNEVDRYIAMPGQALAYMIGRVRIQRAREHARRRLGAAFDIRTFHHLVLADGAVPLDTLERTVADWAVD